MIIKSAVACNITTPLFPYEKEALIAAAIAILVVMEYFH